MQRVVAIFTCGVPVGDFSQEVEQYAAHYQRNQRRQDQCFHGNRVARRDLVEVVRGLEFLEQQFDFPPRSIQLGDVGGAVLRYGKVRHVQVVLLRVVVPDPDDVERPSRTAARAVVCTTAERYFGTDIAHSGNGFYGLAQRADFYGRCFAH